MINADPPYEIFSVVNFEFESGIILPEISLAFRVSGDVRRARPILTCTAFSQTPLDLTYLSVPGGPLDPDRRPVIRSELLGNGRSSSPSNAPAPYCGVDFPVFTIGDNVRLQARLLDHLGIDRVACVIGASMGGQQAVEWAVSNPDRVGAAVAIAANARTTFYGRLFLHSVGAALKSDPAFDGGRYQTPPLLGLSRLSETWAPFALSQRFFNTGRWRDHPDMAADNIDGFIAKWRTRYHRKDANDLLSHLAAWAAHDVARTGDLESIGARTNVPILFMPISTDAYFHPDDVRDQACCFRDASVKVIDSLSGHAAAFGREADDRTAICGLLEAFLREQGL